MTATSRAIRVDDPADARLAPYRDLSDAQLRQRVEAGAGLFVVEGRIAVAQLLRSEHAVASLLVDERRVDAVADLVSGVLRRGAPVYVAPRDVLTATVGFDLHRGVVAMARRPPQGDPGDVLGRAARRPAASGAGPIVAVLEGLNDHENLGALFRNAAAFGVAGVLLDPTCADPLYRRSVRVSSGHVLRVPFARFDAWPAGLVAVRAAGFTVVALSPARAAPATPSDAPRRPPRTVPLGEWARAAGVGAVALLMGAEGPGLSDAALEAADVVVGIPMAPEVDSLNVATAAAIAFHRLSGLDDQAGAPGPGTGGSTATVQSTA